MLWEILKASKGILVADLYADLWANIAGGGTPVDVFVEMIGSLPLYYNGKGIDLTDYLLSGNTIQDGTPSPEAPADVAGCGTDTASGYKLPLTVNGTEYPIYLGQVETTRRIKKLVLTGEEDYYEYSFSGTLGVYVRGVLDTEYTRAMGICSHYPVSTSVTVNTLWIGANDTRLYFVGIRDALGVETAAEVKVWVTQQYAAGMPVTVWYVLAEPETAIVNEPLMKIGDYADTVSFAQAGVTIPTVNGANALGMASTVKPSEVYIKGKGIKPTGYGQLTDVNGVNILDEDGRPIYVHGQ